MIPCSIDACGADYHTNLMIAFDILAHARLCFQSVKFKYVAFEMQVYLMLCLRCQFMRFDVAALMQSHVALAALFENIVIKKQGY